MAPIAAVSEPVLSPHQQATMVTNREKCPKTELELPLDKGLAQRENRSETTLLLMQKTKEQVNGDDDDQVNGEDLLKLMECIEQTTQEMQKMLEEQETIKQNLQHGYEETSLSTA